VVNEKNRECTQLLTERLFLKYKKRLLDNENYHENYTTLIEFSRSTEHGGYQETYQHLSDEILERAAIRTTLPSKATKFLMWFWITEMKIQMQGMRIWVMF
jgi:hypothetical protein